MMKWKKACLEKRKLEQTSASIPQNHHHQQAKSGLVRWGLFSLVPDVAQILELVMAGDRLVQFQVAGCCNML